jgi:hypothetical protein
LPIIASISIRLLLPDNLAGDSSDFVPIAKHVNFSGKDGSPPRCPFGAFDQAIVFVGSSAKGE